MPLEPFRQSLDRIDSLILSALAERMRCVEALCPLKLSLGLPWHDPEREAKLLRRLHKQAARLGLSQTFVESLYRLILEESLRVQQVAQKPLKRHAKTKV